MKLTVGNFSDSTSLKDDLANTITSQARFVLM